MNRSFSVIRYRIKALRISQQVRQNRFLRMHTVMRFGKDAGLWAILNFVGDFLSAMRRETVHDDTVRVGGGDQFPVDLIGREDFFAFGFFAFLSHADPGVRAVGLCGAAGVVVTAARRQIGRASCRERV